jgi:ribosome-associated translation inhibitor RaiA
MPLSMRVQVDADPQVPDRPALTRHAERAIQQALAHFNEGERQVPEVRARLSTTAAPAGERGEHFVCELQATLPDGATIDTVSQAGIVRQALHAAIDRLKRDIETALSQQFARRHLAAASGGEGSVEDPSA